MRHGVHGHGDRHGQGHPRATMWAARMGRGGAEGFGGGGRMGGRFGGGGRRGPFEGVELRLVLLKLIADAPRHGYELMRAIEEATGGAYVPSPGTVYPMLTMLAELGQIAEEEGGGARRRFAASEAGRAQLADKAAQVARLFERLSALRDDHARIDPSPVRRAMHGLHQAIRDRLGRGQPGDTSVHDIADMLDELTRRIERG